MKLLRWSDPIGRYYFFRGLLGRVYLPILVIYMLDRGLTVGQVALISTLAFAASFIFEVPSGAIADHIGHRRTLIISLLGQALAALCYLGGTFPWMLVAGVGYMAAGSLLTGTGEALFFEYLKSQKREADHLRLSGEGKSFSRIFNILSVTAGGFSYTIHPFLPFIICSAQFILAAGVISTFPNIKQRASVEKTEGMMALLQHFPNAIKTIWREPRLFWMVLVNAFILGSTFGSADFQQIIFQNLGATATFIGIVYALKRILSLLLSSRVHLLAKHMRPAQLMTLLSVLCLLHYMLIPIALTAVTLTIVVLIASTVFAILEVAYNDYMNQLINSHSRATTLSVSNFTRTFVSILVVASFGFLSHMVSVTNIYPIIGVIQAVILIIPLVMLARAYRFAH